MLLEFECTTNDAWLVVHVTSLFIISSSKLQEENKISKPKNY